jgi:RNA polymerase sigma factor (sigma-70 family)
VSLALGGASDAELVALARSGGQAAYRALTERHRDSVYRLARGATGDAEEAFDVTQEAFIAAFGALDRYDPARPFRSWIARIALNKARDAMRRRTVRKMFSFAMRDDIVETPDPAVPADDALASRQELARASAAIADLPTRLKDVLLLRTVESMSQNETAAALGISEKAVETRLYRARKTLLAVLTKI